MCSTRVPRNAVLRPFMGTSAVSNNGPRLQRLWKGHWRVLCDHQKAFFTVEGHSNPKGEASPFLQRGGSLYPTRQRTSFSLWRWAIPTAAASITSKLSNDLAVTLAIPLSVIFPNPSSSFTRLFTRSTDVRSRYSLTHFLLSLGTGACLLGSCIMDSLST